MKILTCRNEAIKFEIEMMEKEILYFTGKKRKLAKEKYLRLLNMCNNSHSIKEPIYLNRSE